MINVLFCSPLHARVQLVPFLACEGLGDIGPVGQAFIVVGLRQGVADVAALSPSLFAALVGLRDVASCVVPVPHEWGAPWERMHHNVGDGQGGGWGGGRAGGGGCSLHTLPDAVGAISCTLYSHLVA